MALTTFIERIPMSIERTISGTVIDVVGTYTKAARTLVAGYRAGTQRMVEGIDRRYTSMVGGAKLPLVNDGIKEKLVNAQQRLGGFVVQGVSSVTERADAALDSLASNATKGIETISEKTTWVQELPVVAMLRPAQLQAAKLSLQVADKVAQGADWLSERLVRSDEALEVADRATETVKRAGKVVHAEPVKAASKAKPAAKGASRRAKSVAVAESAAE
jgi:hypothetical protein